MTTSLWAAIILSRLLKKIYSKLREQASEWVPRVCVVCGSDLCYGLDLCSHCIAVLVRRPQGCKSCGDANCADDTYCEQCLASPHPVDRFICPFSYHGVPQILVSSLKFKAQLSSASIMASLMSETVYQSSVDIDAVVAVPLHAYDFMLRGFNQSTLLAQALTGGTKKFLPERGGKEYPHQKTAAPQ